MQPASILATPFAARRDDDQGDVFILEIVDQVAMALGNLLDALHGDALGRS